MCFYFKWKSHNFIYVNINLWFSFPKVLKDIKTPSTKLKTIKRTKVNTLTAFIFRAHPVRVHSNTQPVLNNESFVKSKHVMEMNFVWMLFGHGIIRVILQCLCLKITENKIQYKQIPLYKFTIL